MASTALDTWKDWLAYHMIEDYAGVLPKALADERYAFFGATLQGTPQQRPRWQRGVFLVNRYLGDDVGQIYAQRYFSPQAKAEAQAMVSNIIAAFRKRIDALAWMAASTKAEAQAKLNTLYVGVGYPETWIDYSAYDVKPDDIFGNIWRGNLFEYHRRRRAPGRAGRSQGMVDGSADGERGQSAVAECAELPGRDFAAAVLRSAGSGSGELWRYRLGDRTRDQPHLRLRRFSLRLQGSGAQLVDAFRLRALRSRYRETRRSVRYLQAVPRCLGQRQADAVGEHRRPGRRLCGL